MIISLLAAAVSGCGYKAPPYYPHEKQETTR